MMLVESKEEKDETGVVESVLVGSLGCRRHWGTGCMSARLPLALAAMRDCCRHTQYSLHQRQCTTAQ